MRKRDAAAHIVEHEHDKRIEYSVDRTGYRFDQQEQFRTQWLMDFFANRTY